jgi:DnaJ like chaperone protein
MRRLKKWIYLAIVLVVLYYIFIENILITLSVIASAYVALRVYRIYARNKLIKTASSKETFRKSELGIFIALVAKVAKADGRVDELEAELIGMMFDDISRIFPDKEKTRAILKEIFNDEKKRIDDTRDIAETLDGLLGYSQLKRKQYMEFLIQLAFVDNGISSDEDKVLRIIVDALNITSNEYDAMISRFEAMLQNQQQTMSTEEAYKILGVNKGDDMNSIKKIYRKQVRKYHPDLIESQDKDAAYIEESTAKMQELNQAYDIIKEAHRGV